VTQTPSLQTLLKATGISNRNGFNETIISSLNFSMASNTALSQTIQSLTLSKICELEKLRNTYQSHESEILMLYAACNNRFKRLKHLLTSTEELYPSASQDVTISHIKQWLS
jgi:hypothetical protein